jgi:hypothetical protein
MIFFEEVVFEPVGRTAGRVLMRGPARPSFFVADELQGIVLVNKGSVIKGGNSLLLFYYLAEFNALSKSSFFVSDTFTYP